MEADLHIHTMASDGTNSPEEVVDLAKKAGLAAIGITDHDTVDGIAPALARGTRLGVEVVPGVEINTEWEGLEIHILGYCCHLDDGPLLELLKELRQGRARRLERMLERLREVGLPLSRERVLEIGGPGAVGRPHVARAMLEAGYVSSIREAFERFLGTGRVAYVGRDKLSPDQAIQKILHSGGVPVLAHPGLLERDDLIRGMVDSGLMGLEVYYPQHSQVQTKHYLELARLHGLLVTGGSDWHGAAFNRSGSLGEFRVQYELVQVLKKAARSLENTRNLRFE